MFTRCVRFLSPRQPVATSCVAENTRFWDGPGGVGLQRARGLHPVSAGPCAPRGPRGRSDSLRLPRSGGRLHPWRVSPACTLKAMSVAPQTSNLDPRPLSLVRISVMTSGPPGSPRAPSPPKN